MAAAFSQRTLTLLLLALALGGALYFDRFAAPVVDAPTVVSDSGGVSLWQQSQELKAKIANLRYWAAERDEIQTAYFHTASQYADRMVDRIAITPAGVPPTADQVETMLQQKLNSYEVLDDVKLAVGNETNSPETFTADIGFSTSSSATALAALLDFAYPNAGTSWQQLTVTTDRAARRVVVSGKLQILASEAAE